MQIDFNKKFKVTMSLHQKYNMLRLAEGLVKRDNLDVIYSIYPKYMVSSSYAIPEEKLKSFRLIGALRYFFTKIRAKSLDERIVFFFDRIVSLSLGKAAANQIFHGLNLSCEYSLKQAKKLGFITFLERACPHVDFQNNLLNEESFLLLGVRTNPADNKKTARMKREYELTDYIVVPSNYSLRSFVEKGFPREKIFVVPLSFEKQIPLFSRKAADKLRILCIGGNFYRKGIFYLLKAWEALNLKDAELVIKGGIPEKFSDLLKIKNVKFINQHLSDSELIGLYQSANVFVLPSIDDGFGLVVAEAMAAGLPVIVTENVGIADSIQNYKNGFIVPIRNEEALAERIRFFYDNPDKINEMSKNAIAQSAFYKPEAYTERMIKAYQSVL